MVEPMPVIVAMLVVTMVMLGELGLITTRMTGVIDDNRHGKLVGLRNLLDRFPICSTIHKPEVLMLGAFPTGLNGDRVGGYAGQPEARRDARLEDRLCEDAFLRGDALQFRAVEWARVRALVIFMEMGKDMAMTVPVPTVLPQIAPCGDGKPAAKGNKREARDRIDDVAEAFGEGDSCQPDDYRDKQCREDVPGPGLKRGTSLQSFQRGKILALQFS